MGSVPQNKLMGLLENNKKQVKDDNETWDRAKQGYKLCSSFPNRHIMVQCCNSLYQNDQHHSHTTVISFANVTQESYVHEHYTNSIHYAGVPSTAHVHRYLEWNSLAAWICNILCVIILFFFYLHIRQPVQPSIHIYYNLQNRENYIIFTVTLQR